jgi:hypothetical protein
MSFSVITVAHKIICSRSPVISFCARRVPDPNVSRLRRPPVFGWLSPRHTRPRSFHVCNRGGRSSPGQGGESTGCRAINRSHASPAICTVDRRGPGPGQGSLIQAPGLSRRRPRPRDCRRNNVVFLRASVFSIRNIIPLFVLRLDFRLNHSRPRQNRWRHRPWSRHRRSRTSWRHPWRLRARSSNGGRDRQYRQRVADRQRADASLPVREQAARLIGTSGRCVQDDALGACWPDGFARKDKDPMAIDIVPAGPANNRHAARHVAAGQVGAESALLIWVDAQAFIGEAAAERGSIALQGRASKQCSVLPRSQSPTPILSFAHVKIVFCVNPQASSAPNASRM